LDAVWSAIYMPKCIHVFVCRCTGSTRGLCDSRTVTDPALLASITAYFRQIANPPDSDIAQFAAQAKRRLLEPGECFCSLGQKMHEVAFIKTGIVRYFVTLPDGEEASKDFSVAGSFTLSFGSAAARLPAQVAIAAVVPTELVVWPYQLMLDLYASDIEWQKLGRRIAELLYVRKEQRELSFLLLDAPERYRRFREQFGPHADRIPQYYIASYLGIRPQSLSRLRKKLIEKS
jgi:CRP-like cAMP-binding protein